MKLRSRVSIQSCVESLPVSTRRASFVLTAVVVICFASGSRAGEPRDCGRFLHNGVTAHRGNSAEWPENTLAAFRSAIEVGADWIELDVYRTRDGQLVVIHDRNTARVGDKNLVVAESTYEQLLTVDVATGFRKQHGKGVEDCQAHRIPLLEDVLRIVTAQCRTRVSLQPKMDCVADAMALVKRFHAEKWVGFNDGNLAYMAEVKRLAPAVPVFWDLAKTDIDADIRTALEHRFESVVLKSTIVTAECVTKLKQARIEVGVWTVNDPETMRRLLQMGVERIYTDDPRALLALQAERKPTASKSGAPRSHRILRRRGR